VVGRGALTDAFRSSWRGEEPPDEAVEEEALAALVAGARAAWPALAPQRDPAAFVAYVAARLPGKKAWREELARTSIDELFLAFTCGAGDARAFTLLDERYLAEVPRYVAHLDRSPAFADEVRQSLRERLLLGSPPKIGEYAGKGPLGGWLRVAALRIALNARRGRARKETPLEGVEKGVAATADPELDVLRARYAGAVQRALEATVQALPVDQRNVLRTHYLDDLSIDRIAAVHGVHRSTAARWITEARAAIVEETKRRLAAELGARQSEIGSIVALVQSQLAMSLRSLLPPE
jgi:RNA polymerase sigma-70 factor (ECF subfamily)